MKAQITDCGKLLERSDNMTLKEAKEVYKRYNGSLFAMAREEIDSYNLYKDLNISNNLEMRWKYEMIDELYSLIKRTGDAQAFYKMYNIAENMCDKKILLVLIRSIKDIKIDDNINALHVAEDIMGRKRLSVRSGMIFWAYDMGLKKEAKELINIVRTLISIETNDNELKKRADKDKRILSEICNLLKE